jgi:hypothetical protein
MGWRDRIAKMIIGGEMTAAETRRAEQLLNRGIADPSLLPPRTDLTTDAYHGTRRVFPSFQPWTYDEAGTMDRALGTHAAKDPAMSSEAFAGMPKDYNRMGAQEYENLAEKPHVIPLKIPDESRFLQADQPLIYPGGEGTPTWKQARTDTTAIENMISREAFLRNPDALKEYLERGRAYREPEARAVSRALVAGESVPINHSDKTYDLPGLINNYIARPYDKQFAVDAAREAWQDQGYKGIRYINTAPLEAGAPGVKDPTSYIVFSPADIRSRFAKFASDPASMASPDLLRGAAIAPVGMGAAYDQSQYEVGP